MELAMETSGGEKSNVLTEMDIERVAERLLVKSFELMGVDISTPDTRKEFRTDLDYLRSWRRGVQSAQSKAIGASIFVIISGLLTALWMGASGKTGVH